MRRRLPPTIYAFDQNALGNEPKTSCGPQQLRILTRPGEEVCKDITIRVGETSDEFCANCKLLIEPRYNLGNLEGT